MFHLARPSTQPHPLPATPPPLARPFIPCPLLVLADRASAARPASSSTLSRHTPPPTRTRAATHLHTTAPCARFTLFIAAPHSFHHRLHFTPLAPASRSPTSTSTHPHTPLTATSSSLCVFRQHVSYRSVAVCNTAHTIALSLPILASRIRGSFAPLGWAVACGLVGSGAWSDWEAKAFVQHSLTPAPIARPASREAIATPRCLPSTVNKGLVLQRQCGRQWDAACPSTSPTQLDMAANEKRRSHDACLVTSAWSSKAGIMLAAWPSLASLHVEVGRELDLHHLDMVVADR